MNHTKTFLKYILIMLSTMAFTACSGETWKEEALQADGSVIIVERTVDRGGRHEIGQEPPIKLQTLRFKLPGGGGTLEWKTDVSKDLGYADFQPLTVHVLSNTAYIVTKPVGCLSYNKWGRPNPPYVIFKSNGTAWQQITVSELPIEVKAPNIIFSSPDTNAKKTQGMGTIKVEGVNQVNSSLEQPEYRSILREPLSKGRIVEMCGDRILYKGHWIVPNSPTAKAIIDAQQK